jgi:putative ABC transport system permease protein
VPALGQVRTQFPTEAVLLSVLGGPFGVLLGLAVSIWFTAARAARMPPNAALLAG